MNVYYNGIQDNHVELIKPLFIYDWHNFWACVTWCVDNATYVSDVGYVLHDNANGVSDNVVGWYVICEDNDWNDNAALVITWCCWLTQLLELEQY